MPEWNTKISKTESFYCSYCFYRPSQGLDMLPMLCVHPSSMKGKKQHHPYLLDPAAQNILQNKHSQDEYSGTLIRSQMQQGAANKRRFPQKRQRPSLSISAIPTTQEQDEHLCLSIGSQKSKLILMFLGLILGRQISLLLPLGRQLFPSGPVRSAERVSLCLPVFISRTESNSNSPAGHSSNGNTCWKYPG